MFAIINKEIGNLWWLGEAASAKAAMQLMAEELDGGLYDWFFIPNADKAEMDYFVYDLAGLDVPERDDDVAMLCDKMEPCGYVYAKRVEEGYS